MRGLSQVGGRYEKCVDVLCGFAGVKHEAHDYASGEIQFSTNPGSGQFIIQERQQFMDALRGEPHTRSPRLESMKIFRRRNGTGDAVSRCALRLIQGTANRGSAKGSMVGVQSGGWTLRR